MASKLKVQEVILQSPNGLVEKTVSVGNDGVVTGAGKVIQMAYLTTNNTFSTNAVGSWTEITPLTLSITPTSSTSKIRIDIMINYGGSADARFNAIRLTRNNVDVAIGNKGSNGGTNAFANLSNSYADASINNTINAHLSIIDSPNSTSLQTYRLLVNPLPTATIGRTFYLNRPENLDDANRMWTVSSVILTEIGV